MAEFRDFGGEEAREDAVEDFLEAAEDVDAFLVEEAVEDFLMKDWEEDWPNLIMPRLIASSRAIF